MSISPGLTLIFFITHPIHSSLILSLVLSQVTQGQQLWHHTFLVLESWKKNTQLWDVFFEAQAPKTSTYYWIFLLKKSHEITVGLMLSNLVAPQFSYIPKGRAIQISVNEHIFPFFLEVHRISCNSRSNGFQNASEVFQDWCWWALYSLAEKR